MMNSWKNLLTAIGMTAATLSLLLVTACSHTTIKPNFETGKMESDRVIPKVDEFVVIVDGSISMSDLSGGQKKLDIATAAAESLVGTIPDGILPGSVRSFGQGDCLPREKTSSLYSSGFFSSADAISALAAMTCAGGSSPLDKAIDAVGESLLDTPKRLAVFIVSDGRHMGKNEVRSARQLNSSLPDGACFYPIQVSRNEEATRLLEEIAAVSSCGRVVSAAELSNAGAMTAFAKSALFDDDTDGDGVADDADRCPETPARVKVDDVGCPLDTDGDGVADFRDACANTPRGVKVDSSGCSQDTDGDGVVDSVDRCPNTLAGVSVDDTGCPLDSDNDGITDDRDACPNTPKNTPVDDRGCPIQGIDVAGDEWHVSGEVLFDLNKDVIRPDAKRILNQIAMWLDRNQDVSIIIEGHTDSSGSASYNLNLSERRAEAVKAYLIGQSSGDVRLMTVGKGESEPLVANDSVANRQRNRRVELRLVR